MPFTFSQAPILINPFPLNKLVDIIISLFEYLYKNYDNFYLKLYCGVCPPLDTDWGKPPDLYSILINEVISC